MSSRQQMSLIACSLVATERSTALAAVVPIVDAANDNSLTRMFAATPGWDRAWDRRAKRVVVLQRAVDCRPGERFDIVNDDGSSVRGRVTRMVNRADAACAERNLPLAHVELEADIDWSDTPDNLPLKLAVRGGLGPRDRVARIHRRRLTAIGAPDLLRLARRHGPYFNISHLEVARVRFADGGGMRFVHVEPEPVPPITDFDVAPRTGLIMPLNSPPRVTLPLVDVVRVVAVVDLDGDGVFEVVTDAGGYKFGGVFDVRQFDGQKFIGERRELYGYGC